MVLQKNYNPGQDAPLWQDCKVDRALRPDELIEELRSHGLDGEYRIFYASHGQVGEQRFTIERYDAYKVRHKATGRKAVDASKGGTDSVADGTAKQPNASGNAQ